MTSAAELVARFEGFEAHAYYCPAGVLTLGFGSTRDAEGRPIKPGATITPAEARKLLERDLASAEAAIRRYVQVPLTEGQRSACASLIYNIGPGAFAQSTLLRKLNAGDMAGASAEFGKWVKANGQTLPGLVRRRAAERDVFLGG